MDITEKFKQKAKTLGKTIVLPEGTEPRTVKASSILSKEGYVKVILVGNEDDIKKVAAKENADISGVQIIDPVKSDKLQSYASAFYEMRKSKGVTEEQALETMKDSIYYGTMMVQKGDADGLVSGAEHSTGDTVRPSLQIIKTKPGISIVSGYFLMIVPDCEFGDNGMFIFADSGLVPDPNPEELAAIAISSAQTAKILCDMDPVVAMLSFSTKGSATHPLIDKVIQATKIAQEKAPDLKLDGELQLDAAIVESISMKKAPGNKVAGKANVLIFPDLNSGNIAYKLVERLAKAHALGPLLQGLNKPVNDLSRGCSVDDIVNVAVITAIQSNM
ncbi:MAG: phosphate acetyltransferase [Spirochaetes bacterium]|nr:phosphate acetyltransferase [Spirochaetota bacterium]